MILAALAALKNEEQSNELGNFYEKNKHRFFAIAGKYLKNMQDVEDAIQESFLRISDKPDKFFSLPDTKRISYVCAIIKNVSIDMFKKKSKKEAREISDDIVFESVPETLEDSLFDKISRNEILSFIDNLPPLQRNVLILTCLSGLSISETAETLKISVNSVNQRLYLARKAIREFIAERSKKDE